MNRGRGRSDELVAMLHRIGRVGAEQLLRRIENPQPGEKPPSLWELNAVTGTAIDKIAKFEGWERKGAGEAGEWVKALVLGLSQIGGGKVTLEVEATPEPTDVRVIEAETLSRRDRLSPDELARVRAADRARQQKSFDKKQALYAAQGMLRELEDADG